MMILMMSTWLPRSRNSLLLTSQKTFIFPVSYYSWKGNQPSSLILKPQVSLAGLGTSYKWNYSECSDLQQATFVQPYVLEARTHFCIYFRLFIHFLFNIPLP